MSNKVYPAFILKTMKGDKDHDTMDLRFLAMSSSYTYSDAHDKLDDLTNIVSDAVAATGETVASVTGGGNLDCADLTLTNVTGTAAKIASYDHTGGADSARDLVSYYDTGVTGLPVTLSGGTIPLTINAGGVYAFTTA